MGTALSAARLARNGEDHAATGFALLAVAEAIMSSGTAAPPASAMAAFGAGVALYVPALLFISVPRVFPTWARIAGIVAAAPFLAEAVLVFDNRPQPPTGPLPSAGYAFMTIAVVGWIVHLLRGAFPQAQVTSRPKAS